MPWWAICVYIDPVDPNYSSSSFPAVHAWCLCQGVGLAVADMIFDGGFDGRDGGFGGFDGGFDGGWDGGYDGGW